MTEGFDDATIDAEIQRELDAISLSSLDVDDAFPNEDFGKDSDFEIGEGPQDFPSTILYLEKLSERNKVAQDILNEAEVVINQSNTAKKTPRISEEQMQLKSDHFVISSSSLTLDSKGKQLVSAKTSEEIEEENRVKLEELEEQFKVDEEKDNLQFERMRTADEDKMKAWMDKEVKLQRNVKVMLDKEAYWEKTYKQAAEDELTEKESELEKDFIESQNRILVMKEEQERILKDLLLEKERLHKEKTEDAALHIQASFRGYVARKKFGAEVKKRIVEMKEKKRQKKIEELDRKRAEEKARKEEEKRLREKEEEDQRRKKAEQEEIEQKRKAEKKARKKAEKERKKQEKREIQEREKELRKSISSSVKEECSNEKTKIDSTASVSDSELVKISGGSNSLVSGASAERETNIDCVERIIVGVECDVVDEADQNDTKEGLLKDTKTSNEDSNTALLLPLSQTINEDLKSLDHENQDVGASNFPVKSKDTTEPHTDTMKLENKASTVSPNSTMVADFVQTSIESSIEQTEEIPQQSDQSGKAQEDPKSECPVPMVHRGELVSEVSQVECKQDLQHQQEASDDAETVELQNPETCELSNDRTSDDNGTSMHTKPVTTEHVIGPSLETAMHYQEISPSSCDRKDKTSAARNDSTAYNTGDKIGHVKVEVVRPTPPETTRQSINQLASEDLVTHDTKKQFETAASPEQVVENTKGKGGPGSCLNVVVDTALVCLVDKSKTDDEVKSSSQNQNESSIESQPMVIQTLPPESQYNAGDSLSNPIQKYGFKLEKGDCEGNVTVGSSFVPLSRDNEKASSDDIVCGQNMSHACYSERLSKLRQLWLESFLARSKLQDLNKSPSVSKKRRIIRKSSAARRLEPFSNTELLEGGFLSPDCRADKKASSVEEAKCVVLFGIQSGRNLTTITNCTHLTHLVIQNCGLLSIENLQSCSCLKVVNFSHNAVNIISCSGMRNLESLDLSHNRLTSIHGLEGCQGLAFLDLSHNDITKIAGLEELINLSHLRISNNQVISISGLRCCDNLLYLDVSENHLMSLEDLENCKLLLSICAAGNNLDLIGKGFICNAVLLMKIDVSRNNLSDLGFSSQTWLPMLTEIYASINKIGTEDNLDGESLSLSTSFPFLSYLDLSKNLISNVNWLRSLTESRCLNKVDLTDNPLGTESQDKTNSLAFIPEVVIKKQNSESEMTLDSKFPEHVTKFSPLHNFGKKFVNLNDMESDVIAKLSKIMEKIQAEVKKYSLELQRAAVRWEGVKDEPMAQSRKTSPPIAYSLQVEHLRKMQDMAFCFRNAHENVDLMYASEVKSPITYTNVTQEDLVNSPSKKLQVEPQTDGKPVQNELLKAKHTTIQTSSTHPFVKNDLELKSEKVAKKMPVQSQNLEDSMKKISPDVSSLSVLKSSAIYEKLNLRKGGVFENVAAKKIQALWRGYYVRKQLGRIKDLRMWAATKIQAEWRGYHTRKKIKKALDLLKKSDSISQNEEEFEDVDLGGFEFDEESFDEQWAYKVADLRQFSPEPASYQHKTSVLGGQYITMASESQPAREHEDSFMSFSHMKPPLPPIPSREGTPVNTRLALSDVQSQDHSSVTDSNRTKKSVRQEILSNEWGIKSSSTADLMMKRARKMKGGRKKSQTAEQKLHRFQEKISTFHYSEPLVTKRQQPSNKVEYFKAREQSFTRKDKVPTEEDEQKMKYTYEWLHTQVGSNYDPPLHKLSPPRKENQVNKNETKRTRSKGFFPVIPRSPSLVGAQDLEIISVASGSTYLERSKERLRDIAKRHNPSFKGHIS